MVERIVISSQIYLVLITYNFTAIKWEKEEEELRVPSIE
jgi:hypothetical protein